MRRMIHYFCTAAGLLLLGVMISGLAPLEVRAQIYSVLEENSTTKYLVTIDPATGSAQTAMGAISVGGFSTGVSAFDPNSGSLYFTANNPGENRRRLFGVNTYKQVLFASSLIDPPRSSPAATTFNTTPAFIFFFSGRVQGLLAESPAEKYLRIIDGASDDSGFSISAGGFSGGVGAFSGESYTAFFTAEDPSGSGRAIFSVNLKTRAVTSSLISPPAGFEAEPVLIEAQLKGGVLAIFRKVGAESMILARLNAGTGNTTPIGAEFPAGGYSSGVSCLDPRLGIIYFTANAPGETARRLYSVSTRTGGVLANPVITSGEGLKTSPILLACVPGGIGPGSESTGGDGEFAEAEAKENTGDIPQPLELSRASVER